MRHHLKIFWSLSLISIKTMLTHRVGVISFMLGKIIRFIIFFLFIYYLLTKTRFIAGYNLNQALLFFLTFNFIDTLSQFLFREVYRFRPLVISGQLDSILLKPYHPFIRILFGGVDIFDGVLIIPYTLLLIFFLLQHMPNFINIVYYLLFILNSLIIASGFHILVLALGILTSEVDHTIMIYRDFIRMVALPVDIYKEPIRTFLTFIIPVGIMITIPVKAFLGLLSWQIVIFSFLISFAFLIFSLYLWKKALEKYQSVGS